MKIISIKYIKGFEIEVEYEDGSGHIFNLESVTRDFVNKYNRFQEILNPDYFCTARLNTDWNTIEWDNGYDICPDMIQAGN
ncbi:DUF2442 domain-containing protein [Clostridium sp.]|jgi:hypothetical protein|uniref:DUF2442 domain-containing protein n=1 Tax=Clostridium sp. TaxID=1506 RepID=UPI002845264E|nr:DUF2442 domain-containing protein [Clostridium sp.]MDR3598840.1 DUF2442 domain-containing protein [Clostridium sp.]